MILKWAERKPCKIGLASGVTEVPSQLNVANSNDRRLLLGIEPGERIRLGRIN